MPASPCLSAAESRIGTAHPAPPVSVVIPTRRRPGLLLRAARSVLEQTYRDFDLIVVIDGEDPETSEALDSIHDPRLRVVTLPRSLGGAGARNAGVREARGRWIAFLDDDDEWLPPKLALQMETLLRTPAPHPIVACRVLARSSEGDLVWPLRTPAAGEPMSEYLFCQSGLRGGEGLILPSAMLTSRALLTQVPLAEDLPRHHDVDWLLRAAGVQGVAVAFVPDFRPLAIWHIETGRTRISNTSEWEYSLNWIRRSRSLVTPRAYAAFVLTWVSSTAAFGRRWGAFWRLPWEALRRGKPRAIDFLAHLTIWLIPRKARTLASVILQRRRSGGNGCEDGQPAYAGER